jgi:hypothetical protein
MPTTVAKIGKTYKDSCKLAQPTSEVTEHFEEGKGAPEVRKKQKKIPVLTFSIMDPDAELLSTYVGGTLTAAAVGPPVVPATWGFNGDEEVSNKAIRVKTEQGLWFDIPNADIEAVVNAEFSSKGIFLVDFTVTPLSVSAGKSLTAYVGATS